MRIMGLTEDMTISTNLPIQVKPLNGQSEPRENEHDRSRNEKRQYFRGIISICAVGQQC